MLPVVNVEYFNVILCSTFNYFSLLQKQIIIIDFGSSSIKAGFLEDQGNFQRYF